MDYKPWRELSDTEKGALLLAHHEGKTIEHSVLGCEDWEPCLERPKWSHNIIYRVKPVAVTRILAYENYRIKFEVINGAPDCKSVWEKA